MSDISNRGYANPDKLVSTAWVADHRNDSNVRVVESNEDPLLYPSGHIPGAVEVDWVKDLNDPLRRDYLDKAGFEALAGRIGHHARDDSRLLRRQEQLVGDLRALGVRAIWSRQFPHHGWRTPEVGGRRTRAHARQTQRQPVGLQRARTR